MKKPSTFPMIRYFLLLTLTPIIALIAISPATAQQEPEVGLRYGLFGLGSMVSHTSDFTAIPGTESCCLSFTGGNGFGFGGGGLVEIPVGSLVVIGGRLSWMSHPFEMTTEEGTFMIVNGTGEQGAFEHRLSGSYGTLGVEPTIGLRLFGHLVIQGGVRLGMPIGGDFEQHEQLTQPTGSGTFLNPDGTDSQKRTRNEYSGSLPDMQLQVAPLVGIGYELPMNSTGSVLLVPEISYQIGVSGVLKGIEWKTNVLRGGIAVKFGPRRSTGSDSPDVDDVLVSAPSETIESAEVETPDIVPVEPVAATTPNLSSSITAVAVESDGTEQPVVRIRVEEFSSTLMTPLLPYVFFDPNSSTIPDRYAALRSDATGAFDIDGVNSPETLPTYYHLLNIVGRRMQENPSAQLTLTGANMDRDEEAGNTTLSRSRAENVKQYLTGVWGLDPGRIRIEVRNLPEKAANTWTDDGAAENRRVEIASENPAILFPIITRDTLRRVDPPIVRFRPTVVGDDGVGSWSVDAVQEERSLRSFDGRDSLPATLDWNIARQVSTIPRTTDPVRFTLLAENGTGASTTAGGRIEVEQITIRRKRVEGRNDVEVDRFSLILFDVRSSDLTPVHRPIIELIRTHIEPTSTVTVTGYTDRLGDATYNQSLAEARAATVATDLGGGSVRAEGIGEADLYNSGLPEARLYTRTVEVVVETGVE